MRTDIQVNVFDIFIFLGIFQGLFLSWFFIKSYQSSRKANLFQGLLLLSLSLAIFEEWLNNTGYIVKILSITNFSEALNFAFAPLFYLYIRSSIDPDDNKKSWIHLLPAIFWMFYLVFQFIQPDEIKYNSYIQTKHPDWGYLPVNMTISDDPLGIRTYVNQLTAISFLIYSGAAVVLLVRKFRALKASFFRTDNELLVLLRNDTIQFLIIILLFIITKIYFGMRSDTGGNIVASYVSLMIYLTSYQAMNRSDYFSGTASFFSLSVSKYRKSSLSEDNKQNILTGIRKEMEGNSYFTNNLASLSGLSKQIGESPHHVSQVINEKMNMNFFELLAFYRVEHAKKLIIEDKAARITVEELAEMVGYNSKSSFNTAFKKLTSKTPSEFRKNP